MDDRWLVTISAYFVLRLFFNSMIMEKNESEIMMGQIGSLINKTRNNLVEILTSLYYYLNYIGYKAGSIYLIYYVVHKMLGI